MDSADHPQSRLSFILLIALILSLFIHTALFFWFRHFPIPQFGEAYYEQIVPRSFHLERVEIDPALLVEPEETPTKPEIKPTTLSVPEDHFSMESESTQAAPISTPEPIQAETLSETIIANSTFQEALSEVQENDTKELAAELDKIRSQLLETSNSSTNRPLLSLPHPDEFGASSATSIAQATATAGFSDLDQLLAETGPLTKDTKPILVPSDVLFDYNASELRLQAIKSLQKLGLLLQRNPQASFIIEGHTDSFGSDAYNQTLSERRAESVKQWLVTYASINPNRIETHGYGKNRLIAPASGSIAQQQINRRVEIRIK